VTATATPAMRTTFSIFLRLGLTSFGGPIAHLGYFRQEFVVRRRWLDERQFAQLLALCQFLPGPASSQLGFSLGLVSGGWRGALAAFAAFTLPSALLMVAFALAVPRLDTGAGAAIVHGLKLVALAVVAHGVLGMARRLCPDLARATIAILAAAALVIAPQAWLQLVVIAAGMVAGVVLCRGVAPADTAALPALHRRRAGAVLLVVFVALLVGLPLAAGLVADASPPVPHPLAVADAFYRAGALVFGGGHVVLPLLEQTVVAPGWIAEDRFLAGYGAAQAVPGPMFSLAAYLGALLPVGPGADPAAAAPGGVARALAALPGAALAVAAIFLPGFLLVAGLLPFWRAVAAHPRAARAVAGVNAAVVGVLAAALWDPVASSGVRGPEDVGIAALGFALLQFWRAPALAVVVWCVAARVVASLLMGRL